MFSGALAYVGHASPACARRAAVHSWGAALGPGVHAALTGRAARPRAPLQGLGAFLSARPPAEPLARRLDAAGGAAGALPG